MFLIGRMLDVIPINPTFLLTCLTITYQRAMLSFIKLYSTMMTKLTHLDLS